MGQPPVVVTPGSMVSTPSPHPTVFANEIQENHHRWRSDLRIVDSNSASSATPLGNLESPGCSPTAYVERPPLQLGLRREPPSGPASPSLRTSEPRSRPPRLRPGGAPPSLTLATTGTGGGPSRSPRRRPPALPTFAQADIAVHVAAAGQAEAQRLLGRLEAAIAEHPAGHGARARRCRRDAQATRRPREAATGLPAPAPGRRLCACANASAQPRACAPGRAPLPPQPQPSGRCER